MGRSVITLPLALAVITNHLSVIRKSISKKNPRLVSMVDGKVERGVPMASPPAPSAARGGWIGRLGWRHCMTAWDGPPGIGAENVMFA